MSQHQILDRVCREGRVGTIVLQYSIPEEIYYEYIEDRWGGTIKVESFYLNSYPEVYGVQWDDGKFERGFLPHGLTPCPQ